MAILQTGFFFCLLLREGFLGATYLTRNGCGSFLFCGNIWVRSLRLASYFFHFWLNFVLFFSYKVSQFNNRWIYGGRHRVNFNP